MIVQFSCMKVPVCVRNVVYPDITGFRCVSAVPRSHRFNAYVKVFCQTDYFRFGEFKKSIEPVVFQKTDILQHSWRRVTELWKVAHTRLSKSSDALIWFKNLRNEVF